jgi:hypothetical protein
MIIAIIIKAPFASPFPMLTPYLGCCHPRPRPCVKVLLSFFLGLPLWDQGPFLQLGHVTTTFHNNFMGEKNSGSVLIPKYKL